MNERPETWVTERFGGPEGIRTLDLFHAMEARSQLRHRPTPCSPPIISHGPPLRSARDRIEHTRSSEWDRRILE